MILAHLLVAIVAFSAVLKLAGNARANLPMICLVLALGLLHGVVPLLTPSDLTTVRATQASRNVAAWYALFGVIAFVMGYDFHAGSRKEHKESGFIESLRRGEDQVQLKWVFWASIWLSLLGIVLTIKSAGVGLAEFAEASRFAFRFEQNAVLMWAGNYLFHLAFIPGFLAHYLPRRERIIGTVFCALIAAFAFFILFKGTRHVTLGILGSSLFGYAFSMRLTPQRLLAIGSYGAVLVVSAVSLYEVRKELNDLSLGQALARTFSAEAFQEPLSRDPLNYHEHLIGAIDYFPTEHPYLNGATYRRMFTFFLPGSEYPLLKPELPGRVFASVVYGDIYESNMNAVHPPSLLGDAYINFWGWPGLFILFANGLVVSWLTEKLLTSQLWFCGVGPHACWFVILGPRGNPYDYYVMALAMLTLSVILLRLASSIHANHKQTQTASDQRRLEIAA